MQAIFIRAAARRAGVIAQANDSSMKFLEIGCSAGQRLAASLRQEQQGDEAKHVARGPQRQRVGQPEPRRRKADRGRPTAPIPRPML